MQMRITLSLPVVRLALALVICCVLIGKWNSAKLAKPSVAFRGIAISLLIRKPISPDVCGEYRTVVLQISSADLAAINEGGPVSWAQTKSLLAEIYRSRAEKVLFVVANRELPYQYIVSDLADLNAEIPNLNAVLLTERQQRENLSLECDYEFLSTHRKM